MSDVNLDPWMRALPKLVVPHGHVKGGVTWNLTPKGICVGGAPPKGSGGEPTTARRVWAWFAEDIRGAANHFKVPVELIVMTICGETASSSPTLYHCVNARRRETGWLSDSETPDRVSVGCMQTLISTARAVLNTPTLSTANLVDPATSIAAGTAYIASQFGMTSFDAPLVAAGYNSGGLYPESEAANRWRLRCYPLGSGRYIDDAVEWFNDAMATSLANAGGAPCLARAMLV
jgi:hypothetical protein